MTLEKFSEEEKPVTPMVRIQPDGDIIFCNYFISYYSLRDFPYAELYFDKEESKIAFKLLTTKTEGSYKRKDLIEGETLITCISCPQFFIHINLYLIQGDFFECEEKDGLWYIDISNHVTKYFGEGTYEDKGEKMTLTKFEKPSTVKSNMKETRITIQKSGNFTFNVFFIDNYNLFDYFWVEFYFDKEENKIALKFLKEETTGSFKLIRRKYHRKSRKEYLCVSGVGFLKFCEISFSGCVTFKAEQKEDLWFIDLNTPIVDLNEEISEENSIEVHSHNLGHLDVDYENPIRTIEPKPEIKTVETEPENKMSSEEFEEMFKKEFEKYSFKRMEVERKRLNVPCIKIYKTSDYISLNAVMIDKYNLQQYKFAEIFYNVNSKKVGIKFHHEDEFDAYKIIQHKGKKELIIPGKSFFKYYKLDNSVSRTITKFEIVKSTLMFVLD